jgi:quinol monooxygenase YgiN
MNFTFFASLAIALGLGLSPTSAQAPAAPEVNPDAPVYVVGYIDVIPSSKNAAIAAFKQFRDACAKEPGNLRCEFVQRLEDPYQFATLQVWNNKKSYDAHAQNPATVTFRDKIAPLLESPYDPRVLQGITVAPLRPAPSGRPTYVITHVDVIPPRTDDAIALLSRMADLGRKEANNYRLEVLQQIDRSNHFSIVELWPNRKVFEARAATPIMIDFRNKLQPMLGAPYDQRLYKILD